MTAGRLPWGGRQFLREPEDPMIMHRTHTRIIISFLACLFTSAVALAQDQLPSWNDGAAKQSIVAFVNRVTDGSSQQFVPPSERIAVFDNDGKRSPLRAHCPPYRRGTGVGL